MKGYTSFYAGTPEPGRFWEWKDCLSYAASYAITHREEVRVYGLDANGVQRHLATIKPAD